MFQATLKRHYQGNNGTIGKLFVQDKFICYMLERPKTFNGIENLSDNRNTPINESCCIPEGEYIVDWTFSPRFKTFMFLLEKTGKRTGIRIHRANIHEDLHGCLAPVTTVGRARFKGKMFENFGGRSGEALDKLYKLVPKDKSGKPEKWKLIIIS